MTRVKKTARRYTCWSEKALKHWHPNHTRRLYLPDAVRWGSMGSERALLEQAGWSPSVNDPYAFVCPACRGERAFDVSDHDKLDQVRLRALVGDYEVGRPGISWATVEALMADVETRHPTGTAAYWSDIYCAVLDHFRDHAPEVKR